MNLKSFEVLGVINRIISKTKRKGDCLIWTKAKDADGYGRMKVSGKVRRAHRLVYALLKGKIPYGMLVLHNCDNPSCCNIEHLRLGTHHENALDRWHHEIEGRADCKSSMDLRKAKEICILTVDSRNLDELISGLSVTHDVDEEHLRSIFVHGDFLELSGCENFEPLDYNEVDVPF